MKMKTIYKNLAGKEKVLNLYDKQLKRLTTAYTLVMAGENDCLFRAELVIPQVKKIIPNCITYLLQGRGHMNLLTDKEKQMIVEFYQIAMVGLYIYGYHVLPNGVNLLEINVVNQDGDKGKQSKKNLFPLCLNHLAK